MRYAWLLPLALLGACAARQPPSEAQIRATAPNASNFQLCGASMFMPEPWTSAARDEIARRGVNCADYREAILQHEAGKRAASAAADAQAMDLARQLLTPPAPLPAPITCDSRALGMGVRTTCR